MTITSKRLSGQGTLFAVIIRQDDPRAWVELARIYLTPAYSPDPAICPWFARDHIFTANDHDFHLFAERIDSKEWRAAAEMDLGSEDDATDRGVKVPATRQGKAELDSLLAPVLEDRTRGKHAVASLSAQRDIERERKGEDQ
jgi:hypothetical protein